MSLALCRSYTTNQRQSIDSMDNSPLLPRPIHIDSSKLQKGQRLADKVPDDTNKNRVMYLMTQYHALNLLVSRHQLYLVENSKKSMSRLRAPSRRLTICQISSYEGTLRSSCRGTYLSRSTLDAVRSTPLVTRGARKRS